MPPRMSKRACHFEAAKAFKSTIELENLKKLLEADSERESEGDFTRERFCLGDIA